MGTIEDENDTWSFDWSDLGDLTARGLNSRPDWPAPAYRPCEVKPLAADLGAG